MNCTVEEALKKSGLTSRQRSDSQSVTGTGGEKPAILSSPLISEWPW